MNTEHGQPWWKFGHMWMVLGGPLVVVVASFITLYLAIKTPDPVVNSHGQSFAPSQALKPEALPSTSLAPAMQARNHAATGIIPVPAKP